MGPRQVVVVGAGLAGLAAAWRLSRSGLAVQLLERAPRPGGRAVGAGVEEDPAAPAGHTLTSGDGELLRLAQEVGLTSERLPVTEALQLHAGRLRAIPVRTPAALRIPGVRLHEALRLVRLERILERFASILDADFPERGARLDDRSLADFGSLYFGPSVVERWMEPFLSARALGDARQTSRLLFLLRYASHAGQAELAPVRLPGGLAGLSARLGAALGVRTGAEAVQLEPAPAGGWRVHFRQGEARGTMPGDAVVLAVPARETLHLARNVLEPAEVTFLGGARTLCTVSLCVRTRGSLGGARHVRVPRSEALPLASIVLQPDEASGATTGRPAQLTLLATHAWSRERADAPDDLLCKELLEALRRVAPELARDAEGVRLERWPEALPCFDVGRFRALARFRTLERELQREGRRLYFAGDHLTGPFLESAVRSGLRAAATVLEDLAPAATRRAARA